MADVFAVAEAGAPKLAGEDEPEGAAQPIEGSQPAAGEVLQPAWSGEEAELFAASLWNVGAFFYGPDWMAHPGEMAAFRDDLAAELDILLPKSIGGPVGHAVHMVKIAGGVGGMVVRRRELIKAGPKTMHEQLKGLREMRAQKQAAQPDETPPGESPEGEKVKFDGPALEVLQQTPPADAYSGLGY